MYSYITMRFMVNIIHAFYTHFPFAAPDDNCTRCNAKSLWHRRYYWPSPNNNTEFPKRTLLRCDIYASSGYFLIGRAIEALLDDKKKKKNFLHSSPSCLRYTRIPASYL